uniref:Uncharacterized protein n=1 Tax=Arundo donax TaxID=35708 RepID=A0A0A8XUQ0_ARUDO
MQYNLLHLILVIQTSHLSIEKKEKKREGCLPTTNVIAQFNIGTPLP